MNASEAPALTHADYTNLLKLVDRAVKAAPLAQGVAEVLVVAELSRKLGRLASDSKPAE